jgi:Tfp pilus assembly protein PilF
MILKHIFPIILLAITFSCTSKQVTDASDYQKYMTTDIDSVELLSVANFLTDKLKEQPNQFPYLAKRANSYTSIFNATGDISYLIKSEMDLKKAVELTGSLNSSNLRALASNYISQHRFKEALELLKQAELNGDKLISTKKMLFDVHLELGNYIHAQSYLKAIANSSDFDYLIRLSKWEDHNGNLEEAIKYMEKATAIAESSNINGLKQWSYTNLADFYGHAGEISKSYNHYLKALNLDPNDAYAKKGIAWILYSYENKPIEALNILNSVSSYYHAPDFDLLKAEIADYLNNSQQKFIAMDAYIKAMQNDAYGVMYNKYNVMLYTEELYNPDIALEIAEEEVQNRPTPQSYDLLAWCYYKKGDVAKANTLIETYVDGKTFEPEILYHIAEIYKSAGKTKKVKELKQELVASLYELGPTMTSKINLL